MRGSTLQAAKLLDGAKQGASKQSRSILSEPCVRSVFLKAAALTGLGRTYSGISGQWQVCALAPDARSCSSDGMDHPLPALRFVLLSPTSQAPVLTDPPPAPAATPTINSSTPHVYSSTSALFEQPTLALSLLSKFAKANAKAFKGLKTSQEWKFGERTVVKGTTLEALATKGVDEKSAQGVLEALLEELAAQSR